jgi:hypothetical protein
MLAPRLVKSAAYKIPPLTFLLGNCTATFGYKKHITLTTPAFTSTGRQIQAFGKLKIVTATMNNYIDR